jgi:hypothetical protein
MEIDMFEHLLKLLVKELLMRCKEVVTSRGVEAEFMDKARESAGKVKEIAQFLQTHGRDELLPQCKVCIFFFLKYYYDWNSIIASGSPRSVAFMYRSLI